MKTNKTLNIRYKNVLELKKKRKIKRFILKNKFLSICTLTLILAVIVNINLIIVFFKILSTL